MSNWIVLSNEENEKYWDYIFNVFHFSPYAKKREEVILLPSQHKCYDISRFYNDGYDQKLYDDLHKKVLIWFQFISKGQRLIAIDWQHDGYSFDCSIFFEKNDFNEWIIPVFPNGDFLFFLSADLLNGIFADGINFKICFFGVEMLAALKNQMPEMLTNNLEK